MDKIFYLLLLFVPITLSLDANPALLWTTKEDYVFPLFFAGHEIDAETFYTTFLQKWVADNGNVVLIVEDHLSLDELAKNGDVYDETGAGGKLVNLKNALDSHVSVEVSGVTAMKDVIKKLRTQISNVKEYEGSSAIPELNKGLTIIRLRKSDNSNHLIRSDTIIGQISRLISEQPYMVIYTSDSSATKKIRPFKNEFLNTGRHLLATTDTSAANYTFFNVSDCFYFYARSITFVYKNVNYPLNTTFSISSDSRCNATETELTVSYGTIDFGNSGKLTIAFRITATVNSNDRWYLSSYEVNYQWNSSEPVRTKLDVSDIFAPIEFSYHCSQPDKFQPNSTEMSLAIVELQVQQGIVNGQFGYPSDCIGFFTIPILSAIFVMIILLSILTFGITLVSNITTMDRFDDPKGKTITVNVAE